MLPGNQESEGVKKLLAACVVVALSIAITNVMLLGESEAENAAGGAVILDTQKTIWRVLQTWQSEAARTDDGQVIRIDPYNPRQQGNGGPLQPVKAVTGTDFPPAQWRQNDFDDSAWQRRQGPVKYLYRSLALLCVRGKFEAAGVEGALNLTVGYEGGVVVYVNGQEIGRGNLPAGTIAPDTLADDYPKEAYIVQRPRNPDGQGRGPAVIPAVRQRQLTLKIPPRTVHEGVNVLAIEIHRSSAPASIFMSGNADRAGYEQRGGWWNRCALNEVKLTAPAGAKGIVANNDRPKGYQVWNHVPFEGLDYRTFGDANEGVAPIRLAGARNGVFAGELVVSSTEPVRNLKVSVTELKSTIGPAIPAAAIQVKFPQPGPDHWVPSGPSIVFDDLANEPPASLELLKARQLPSPAMQPVWISVNVPRGIAAGLYRGKVTVWAAGQKDVEVPLEIQVADWDLPDSRDFTTFMNIVESPDSVALQYGVPMWSDAHWKLLDETFSLLGRIGAKQVYVPLVRRTHFGNEHAMVRWVRQADGSLQPDFSIVERYLDLALKHLGKVPVVCFNIADTTAEHKQGMLYTEADAKTGQLKEAVGPAWGTPQSQAMLKGLLEGLKQVMAKRGMESSMMLGMNASSGAAGPQAHPQTLADIQAVCPQAQWVRVSHYWFGQAENRPGQPKYGSISLVGGVMAVFWDPAVEQPFYGWRNPQIVLVYPRTANPQTNRDHGGTRLAQESDLPQHRLFAEAVLLSGRHRALSGNSLRGDFAAEMGEGFQGLRGVGPFGADFWPVLKGASDKTIIGRYGEGYAAGGWGTVSLSQVVQSLLSPGKDAPGSTVRLEVMREALQEAQARIFVQNVLLNAAQRAKLPAQLQDRAEQTCLERTQALRYISEFWEEGIIDPLRWQERSAKLYQLAGEISLALGQGK